MSKPMTRHDESYKLLFSHREMVEDLLRGFVRETWVETLAFSTLEKVNASYVSDTLEPRADDLVWRVRWGQETLYIYLLLEFQSDVQRFMGVRLMSYVALLYQDLLRSRELSPRGLLPPVMPVVIYNGGREWTAPRDVAHLIEAQPEELGRYRPCFSYLVLDEWHLPAGELPSLDNLVAALFALERSEGPDEVRRIVTHLAERLKRPEHRRLQRAFTTWLRTVLLPARLPGAVLPAVEGLKEFQTMLDEHSRDWTRNWIEQGVERGHARGLAEGRAEGRTEGLEMGRRMGEATLLRRQLERRFGTLPASYRKLLEEADAEQLLDWGERLLDAASPEEVFGL